MTKMYLQLQLIKYAPQIFWLKLQPIRELDEFNVQHIFECMQRVIARHRRQAVWCRVRVINHPGYSTRSTAIYAL